MADDRMYLICPQCKESFLLATFHCADWVFPMKYRGAENYLRQLFAFIDRHYAHTDDNSETEEWNQAIHLVYENSAAAADYQFTDVDAILCDQQEEDTHE